MAISATGRLDNLREFYGLLDRLAERVGGVRTLARCSGKEQWPTRGVYFFLENGEKRTESGSGMRVVRVGTHALKDGSKMAQRPHFGIGSPSIGALFEAEAATIAALSFACMSEGRY